MIAISPAKQVLRAVKVVSTLPLTVAPAAANEILPSVVEANAFCPDNFEFPCQKTINSKLGLLSSHAV